MARILVIDDDDVFGEATVRRLSSAGHSAVFQLGPFGTLNAVRSGNFDLIVLDVNMPALDGTQVVHLVRDNPKVWKTKIMLYSSMDLRALGEVARGLDVGAFLSKSAPKHELLKMINEVLSSA